MNTVRLCMYLALALAVIAGAHANPATNLSVSLAIPYNNTIVAGTNEFLLAAANDNVTILGIQFKLDGQNLQTEGMGSPTTYDIRWNTNATTNGVHTMTAVARDAAGTVTSAPFTFIVENNPATNIDDPEPNYNSSQVSIFTDEFDNYSSFSDMVPNGWRCTDGSITPDITPASPLGSCQILDGGYDGTGKAIRLVYTGNLYGSSQEGHTYSRVLNDTQAAMPGHALYVSYYYRITPGGGFSVDDGTHRIFVKWFELWSSVGRAQFSTSYQHCGRTGPYPGDSQGMGGSFWDFLGNSAGLTDCFATQMRGANLATGQGEWHRVTYKYMTQSGTGGPQPIAWNAISAPYAGTGVGNHDGVAQMWVDGTLIISVKANYCGLAIPGGAPTGFANPPHWCEDEDLGAMYVNDHVTKLVFGSLQNGAGTFWPFTFDFDHMTVWRDNDILVAPIVSNGSPTGSLPPGTTNTTMNITTDVSAICHYSNASGTAYINGTTFNITGTTTHSTLITGLQNNTTYNYYVRCANATNTSIASTIDYLVNFSVNRTPAPIPPVASNGAPTGTLPAGTANTTLNVTTDVNASCQYSNVSNTAYTNGTAFNTTGTTTHSTLIVGLQDNTTYNYYIRCANATNTSIVDTTDYTITFTVGISLPPNIADINQDHIVNMADMLLVINDLGKTNGFDPKEDINSDGKINVYDLVLVGQNWGITS